MNLNEKPLYALRDLGTRLGVPSATKYKKGVLIKKIYERVDEIEKGVPAQPRSLHGRPNLKPCFIGIDKDENGKIVFFDTSEPKPENEASDVIPEETILKNKRERESEIKRLEETKKVLKGMIAAIDCYIKTLDY